MKVIEVRQKIHGITLAGHSSIEKKTSDDYIVHIHSKLVILLGKNAFFLCSEIVNPCSRMYAWLKHVYCLDMTKA